MDVLVVDVGGTHVKILASGGHERRLFASGPALTPELMVQQVMHLAEDWHYDVVSVGYPGVVAQGRIASEPAHLGLGWVGYDIAAAFGRQVKVVNDAAMQALGSYDGGRMLFLGLGTGLGSAMVIDGRLVPLELAHLPYRKKGRTFEDSVGAEALARLGKRKWRKRVADVVSRLRAALVADYVVLGGGNVKSLGVLPAGVRLGDNSNAFTGGFRLWKDAVAPASKQP